MTQELDQLAGLAAQADAGAIELDPVDPNAPPPPAVIDYAHEARGMVDMFGALATGYAPKCAPLWAAETKQRIAEATAPVMAKYNFTLGAMPCELVLMVVAGPVLYQTSRIIAQQMNDEKQAAAKVQAEGTQKAAPVDTAPAPEVSPQTALYA